jgi:hypothetical protein
MNKMECKDMFANVFYITIVIIAIFKSPFLFWTLQEITLFVYEIFCIIFYYGPMILAHLYNYMYYYALLCVFCFVSYKCFQFFNKLFDAIKSTVNSIKETVETIKDKVVEIEEMIRTSQ